MLIRHKVIAAGTGLALAAAGATLLPSLGLTAADHLDPPARTDPLVDATPDIAADIADLYVWHAGDRVNMVLTFGGPAASSLPAFYDPDVLYTIHISNAAPATSPEASILIRFGPGANPGEHGVQVTGVPGTTGSMIGSVERTITQNGVMVRAGLFDDPFFFDSQGLRESRSMGTLRFDRNRSFFHGKNVTAVVLSIPRSSIQNGTNQLDFWTTSARIGGQLS